MTNINIINGLVKGISEQIPLVNSFYTQSPYEVWNTKEIQYGSVSFVITKVNTTDTVTTYEAVLYYADRLMEDGLNRDAIHSDSSTVIQTIVGAMNQSDEYIRIEYPVGITLFEQDFTELLAGGYANITIEVEGMGECFDGEFDVPEIVGTSAYYDKDEINELFPLRTELARVSFTGDFSDLKGVPDILTVQEYNSILDTIGTLTSKIEGCVDEIEYNNILNTIQTITTQLEGKVGAQEYNSILDTIGTLTSKIEGCVDEIEYNGLIDRLNNLNTQLGTKADQRSLEQFVEGQNTINVNFAVEMRNKVGSQFFEETVSGINNELDNKVSKQDYTILVEGVSEGLGTLAQEVNSRVKTIDFDSFADGVENTLENKADRRSLEQFVEGQNLVNVNLAVQLEKKVDDDYFDGVKANLEYKIDEKLDRQSFENKMTNIYTKKEIDLIVETQLDKTFKAYVDSDDFISDLEGSITENVDRVIENYVEGEEFRVSLGEIVEEEVSQQIGDYVTVDELVEEVDSQLNQFLESGELDEEVDVIVNEKMGDYSKKSETYSKTEVDRKLNDKADKGDLSVYATKSELYNDYYNREQVKKLIDEADFTVEVDLKNYYQKAETYNKDEIDLKLKNVVVDVDMSDYYKKTEVDTQVNTINGRLNGLQTQIDNIEVGGGGGGDLSDYLTESEIRQEFYTKEEIDDKFDNAVIGVDLTNYYKKTETYNRTEIDKKLSNVTVDMSDYYKKSETYSKSEVYNKTEIDSLVGNIDTILNNVLYVV